MSLAKATLRLHSALNLGGLSAYQLARRTWTKINENELMTRAAAVAFYAMLALVPFLALILTLAVKALPDLSRATPGQTGGVGDQTVEQFENTLQELIPAEAQELVISQITRIQEGEGGLQLISMGLLISIWLASALFLAIIDALNAVHAVEESRSIWKLRLIAIGMTVLQATILLSSLLAIVAWPQIMGWLGLEGMAATLASAVRWVVIFVMILISFALTFYIGPDAENHWEWITPGSVIGAILFILASLGFRIYVQNFANYNETYGSLGGVMVILFWFWITALIFLIAAQINRIIEDASPVGMSTGQKIDPTSPPDLENLPPEPARDRA
ncbi:YihY/virulence factor BrkB family protein [soil metagenome]